MVTLSAYAHGLDTIERKYKWTWADNYVEPIGIVVNVVKQDRRWASDNEQHAFYIQWSGGGPVGRERYGSHFWRNDLKFVR